MKKSCLLLLIVVLIIPAAGQNKMIVVNAGSDTVAVFNTVTNEVVAKMPARLRPQDVRVLPDGKTAYVLNMGSSSEPGNSIGVYNLEKYQLLSTINLGKYTRPHWSVLSADGKILWVACANQNAILEVDLVSQSVSKVWDTKQPGSYNFAVTSTDKIYTANFDTTTVSIINRKTGDVKIVHTGGKPIGIDVSRDGRKVWMTCDKTNEVIVFDAVQDIILNRFPSGGNAPTRLKITNDGRYALVTHGLSKDLSVFKMKEKQLFWKISLEGVFPKGIAVSPDDKFAYVSLVGGDEVLTVDLIKREVVKRLTTGKNPEGIVPVPAIKYRPVKIVYTINENDLVPEGIAYDPVTKSFFISSTYKRKIIRVDENGKASDFTAEGQDGLLGVVGMRVDAKKNILWAASGDVGNGMPIKNSDSTKIGFSYLHKYDLSNGRLIKKYELNNSAENHFLNDLTLDSSGRPYITDTWAQKVYTIDETGDSLKLFADFKGSYSPNGIDITPDNKHLYVAMYASPNPVIGRIELANGKLEMVDLNNEFMSGADGLYFYNNSLLAIMPGEVSDTVTQFFWIKQVLR